jgi:integrase
MSHRQPVQSTLWSGSLTAEVAFCTDRVRRRVRARAAGIPDSYSSHDLRQHYASVLLDAGESVHAVAERLGNTPETVLTVHGHLMPDREDTTRRAVDAAWQALETPASVPGWAGRK